MVGDPRSGLSRRAVLLGSAGALLLAACGGGGDDADEESSGTLELEELDEGDLQLVAPIPPANFLAAGVAQRIPLYVRDFEGAPVDDDPEELEVRVVYEGDVESFGDEGGLGEQVGDALRLPRRNEGIPLAYYALPFTFDRTGVYRLVATVDGQEIETPVQVFPVEDVPIPQLGDPMRPEQTPTFADPRGIDPICTQEPTCPFHETTLTDQLASGAPTALLVGTPAYCQTGICGPVLDVLEEEAVAVPGVGYLHAEPYVRPTPEDPPGNGVAPVVETYGLDYEPTLFVADAGGTVVARLDIIYDRSELQEALALATA